MAEADLKLEKEIAAKEKKKMEKISEFMKHELNDATHFNLYTQYKGIWDMDGLLRLIVDFLTDQKFKVYEKLQRHRHPGPFGVERFYVIDAHRDRDEYHRWSVFVKLETFDESDVEIVQKDGSKKMMAKGRLWVHLYGKVDIDYDQRWEGSWLSINLRKFFNRYIIRKRIELPFWDDMYYMVMLRLHGLITEKLKMESRINDERYRSGVH